MCPFNGQLLLSSREILLFRNEGTCVSSTSNFLFFKLEIHSLCKIALFVKVATVFPPK